MWVTGCLMELWETLFAGRGKAVFAFPCAVNGVFHSAIACYPHFHDARHTDRSKPLPRLVLFVEGFASPDKLLQFSPPLCFLPALASHAFIDNQRKAGSVLWAFIHGRCPPASLPCQSRSSRIPRPASRLRGGGASAFPYQRRSSCQSRTGTCISGALLCRTCR